MKKIEKFICSQALRRTRHGLIITWAQSHCLPDSVNLSDIMRTGNRKSKQNLFRYRTSRSTDWSQSQMIIAAARLLLLVMIGQSLNCSRRNMTLSSTVRLNGYLEQSRIKSPGKTRWLLYVPVSSAHLLKRDALRRFRQGGCGFGGRYVGQRETGIASM